MTHYRFAVIGLGVIGSGIAAHLAQFGSVIGIDQFTPPHDFGSSHGENKMIRAAPGEGATYAALAQQSFEWFAETEKITGRHLLYKTGGIDADYRSNWCERVVTLCREYHLPYQELEPHQLKSRYPFLTLPEGSRVIFQPEFGHLDTTQTWQTLLDLAKDRGATMLFGSKVQHLDDQKLTLGDGSIVTFDKVVVAAGGWVTQLITPPIPIRPERRVLSWYATRHKQPMVPFNFVDGVTKHEWYGMPSLDGTELKIGNHYQNREAIDPDQVRSPDQSDRDLLGEFIQSFTHGLDPIPTRMATCKYTMTANEHFLIDRLPDRPNVIVASCCSGHGFKYAPVLGKVVASLVLDHNMGLDLSLFTLDNHLQAAVPGAAAIHRPPTP